MAFDGKAIAVIDGDTIKVATQGRTVNVRLAEVDAPEKAQRYGAFSKSALARLCLGVPVSVTEKVTDRYGRTVGRVTCRNLDASAEQVRAGMAWAYRAYLTDPAIARLEEQARASRTGLWADSNPVPPWEYRHTSHPPKARAKVEWWQGLLRGLLTR
ncbi:MAG: thermonuclease family protein [Magnetococcales bacterium]|nr:thermonuclease family protein [Magnetococcales bacterium]